MNEADIKSVKSLSKFDRLLLVIAHSNLTISQFRNERGINTQNWNNWKNRGLPYEMVLKFGRELDVFAEWLDTGDPKYAPDWLLEGQETENKIPVLQPTTEQQSLADLIEKNIINKVSPKSRDLLMLIQQAIEENRLTDDMATEIEGYLKIKLSENKSNKDKEKKFNDLKERLLKAQDDTNHGTDNDR